METLHQEWRKNNNSALKNKLSRLQFIATTVATLYYSTFYPYAIALYVLGEIIPKTKSSLFGIKKCIKQIRKRGKLYGIVLNKITQKDMVPDEVGVTNDVLYVLLSPHNIFFIDEVNTRKNQEFIIIVHF